MAPKEIDYASRLDYLEALKEYYESVFAEMATFPLKYYASDKAVEILNWPGPIVGGKFKRRDKGQNNNENNE